MAGPLSEPSTPRGGDAHRRAPDPAGTRPKVDLRGGRATPRVERPTGPVEHPTDPVDRPGDPPADQHAESRVDQTEDPGLGQTFGPTPDSEPTDEEAPAPTLPSVGGAIAAAAGKSSATQAHRQPSISDVIASSGRADSPHASRFQFLIGALIALGVSALAITFLTLRSDRDTVPADWASWHPSATGFAAAAQIASHVGPEYRLATNAQMVAIQSGPLALDGVPLTLVRRSNASTNANVVALNGNAVLYKMCGLAASCSIVGTPSAERLTMIRREALELALDTFEYVGNANQVVVFLPPVVTASTTGTKKTTTGATDALFFQASDFKSELDRPLSTTITPKAPTIGTVDTASDTPVVKALTTPSFYTFSIVPQTADATVFLVLQPFAVG
jgi:hypothetical protein